MRRRLPILPRLLLFLAFVLSLGRSGSAAYRAEQARLIPCSGTIRIMPLGDSITAGKSSGTIPNDDTTLWISYRKDLWDSLNAAGFSVDFVGSQVGGDAYPGFDPQHEGHPGWTDTQIAMNIYDNGENWLGDLGANGWPHIILLHIGTNSLDPSPADVENILKEIDDYETATGNHITVILARIIDWVPNNVFLHQFNDNVANMAQARIENGDDIVIVDMEDGADLIYELQPAGDFYNGLHPWSTGYAKVAAVWHLAVASVTTNCNNPPQITDPGDQTNIEGSSLSLAILADPGDDGQTLNFGAENLPPGLIIGASTGVISGTVSQGAAASSPYEVMVTVQDNGVPPISNSTQFFWTIDALPRLFLPMIARE